VLGTFILWLGWIGFNPGSTLGIASPGSAQTAARCVVNTTLSAATCGLVVVVLDKLFGSRTWDVGAVCNGVLGGLVSISAACSTVYPWAAVLIGAIGGIVCFGTSRFVLYVLKRVDDPRAVLNSSRPQALPQIQLHAPLGSTERTPPPLGAPSPSLPNSCGDALHFLALLLRAGGLVGAFPLFWFFRILIAVLDS
jgi:hypothetical protein